MKKLSISAALALAAIFSAFSAQAQADYITAVKNTPNLLGYWRFSSASQANSEVNGYTGTFVGNAAVGPAHSGPSLIGDTSNSAMLLDGPTGYVSTNLTGQIDQQGSMIGWFRLSALPSTAGRAFVIADASNFGNDFGVQIETDNTLKFYTDSGGHATAPDAFTAADLNAWHFVAVTFTAGQPHLEHWRHLCHGREYCLFRPLFQRRAGRDSRFQPRAYRRGGGQHLRPVDTPEASQHRHPHARANRRERADRRLHHHWNGPEKGDHSWDRAVLVEFLQWSASESDARVVSGQHLVAKQRRLENRPAS